MTSLVMTRPALAAKPAVVPFTLMGLTSSALFPVQNAALMSWLLLLFFPGWKYTKSLVLVAPSALGLLYGALMVRGSCLTLTPTPLDLSAAVHSNSDLVLVPYCAQSHLMQHPIPGSSISFSSLEGIMRGFAFADGAFAGWLHYCVFDPLVGLGIVLDARNKRVPHLLCVPPLILTCLAGPIGFLSYLLVRTVVLTLRSRGVLKGTVFKKAGAGRAWGESKTASGFKGL